MCKIDKHINPCGTHIKERKLKPHKHAISALMHQRPPTHKYMHNFNGSYDFSSKIPPTEQCIIINLNLVQECNILIKDAGVY